MESFLIKSSHFGWDITFLMHIGWYSEQPTAHISREGKSLIRTSSCVQVAQTSRSENIIEINCLSYCKLNPSKNWQIYLMKYSKNKSSIFNLKLLKHKIMFLLLLKLRILPHQLRGSCLLPPQLTVLSRCRNCRVIECIFLFSISKFSTYFELKLF